MCEVLFVVATSITTASTWVEFVPRVRGGKVGRRSRGASMVCVVGSTRAIDAGEGVPCDFMCLLFVCGYVCVCVNRYDMPVSNNGARCRMIVYYKSLESAVEVKSPAELGGLKHEEYECAV